MYVLLVAIITKVIHTTRNIHGGINNVFKIGR
jgi:hypothetical protein